MITKQQALTADEFHHATQTQGNGTECMHVRRNGATQTWKTRPGEWRLPVKWGMRSQFSIHEHDAASWYVAGECPRH